MKKIISIFAAVSILFSVAVLSGCDTKKADSDKNTKLSWWVPMYPAISQTVQNFDELELYQELEKRKGVDLEFVHPPVGQEKENYNVMIASDELTDIITGGYYTGGSAQAIQDGYYIALNDYIEERAPNFCRLVQENDDFRKVAMDDTGDYSKFPFFRGDPYLLSWQGPQIRKDWLDELGLELPETIDDWDRTLRAFQAKGVEFPLTMNVKSFSNYTMPMFEGAYGVSGGWYEIDGRVYCAYLEDGYKEFLTLMNKWYEDGLLDPDFYAQDANTHDAKITSGRAGAWLGTGGGKLSSYLKAFQQTNPDAKISGTKYASLNKGETPPFGFQSSIVDAGMCVYITTDCKNPEKAVDLLDYGYGEEGHMFYNFGVEGVSYEMVDGYPKYTDLITKNADGLDMATAMVHWMASSYGSAFIQDKRYYEQYLQLEEQRDAVSKWSEYRYGSSMAPLTYTIDEQNAITQKETDLNTYVDEMVIKFIVGEEKLENYDKFISKLKEMGVEEVLNVKQTSLDRYNSK